MAVRRVNDEALFDEVAEVPLAEGDNLYSVRALSRGLGILRCFDIDHPDWGVTELSKRLKLNKATIYRLVKTLESDGFLTLEPSSGRYHLGSALLRIAYVGLSRLEVMRVARPHMEALAAATGETVDLTVWTDEGALFVAQVLTSRPFKPVASVGRVFSDLANSHSKVFLAFMSAEKRKAVLAQFEGVRNQSGVSDLGDLAAALREVQAKGVAYDQQENTIGLCSVAAPVFGPTRGVRASLAIVAPAARFGPDEVAKLTAAVREAAAAISRDLGFQ